MCRSKFEIEQPLNQTQFKEQELRILKIPQVYLLYQKSARHSSFYEAEKYDRYHYVFISFIPLAPRITTSTSSPLYEYSFWKPRDTLIRDSKPCTISAK